MFVAAAALAFALVPAPQQPEKPFTQDGVPPVHEAEENDATPVGDPAMAGPVGPRRLELGAYSLYPDAPIVPPLAGPRFDTSIDVVAELPKDPNDAMAEWWRHWNFEYSIYGHGINVQQPMPGGGFNILPLIDWLAQKAKDHRRNRERAAVRAAFPVPLPAESPAAATEAPPANQLVRVQALGLQSLPGTVTTYYSPGAQGRAASLKQRIEEALRHHREQLGGAPVLALAVLNEDHWTRMGGAPYGIPWVSSAPHVVFLPADLDRSVIVISWHPPSGERATAMQRALAATGGSLGDAPRRLNDLIGYHEVGHAVVADRGLGQTQKWFNEMLATLVAYGFLRERHPDDAAVWDALMEHLIDTVRPAFRSLDAFNERYDDSPPDTYAWYQGMFYRRAAHLYGKSGVRFLETLRRAGITPGVEYKTSAELLARLERVSPGFEEWARQLQEAGSRVD